MAGTGYLIVHLDVVHRICRRPRSLCLSSFFYEGLVYSPINAPRHQRSRNCDRAGFEYVAIKIFLQALVGCPKMTPQSDNSALVFPSAFRKFCRQRMGGIGSILNFNERLGTVSASLSIVAARAGGYVYAYAGLVEEMRKLHIKWQGFICAIQTNCADLTPFLAGRKHARSQVRCRSFCCQCA